MPYKPNTKNIITIIIFIVVIIIIAMFGSRKSSLANFTIKSTVNSKMNGQKKPDIWLEDFFVTDPNNKKSDPSQIKR